MKERLTDQKHMSGCRDMKTLKRAVVPKTNLYINFVFYLLSGYTIPLQSQMGIVLNVLEPPHSNASSGKFIVPNVLMLIRVFQFFLAFLLEKAGLYVIWRKGMEKVTRNGKGLRWRWCSSTSEREY